jgi:hypothetical protein
MSIDLKNFIDYHEILIVIVFENEILFVNVVLLIELDYLIENVNANVNDCMNVLEHSMIDYFQNDYDF